MIPEDIFTLNGWCPREKTYRLYNLVKECRADMVVELGVFGGRSLIPMALALRDNNNGLCIGVDPWSSNESIAHYDENDANYKWWKALNHENIYNEFLHALDKYNVKDFVKVYRNTSKNIVHEIQNNSVDVFHQDGNHTEESSTEEVELFHSKVKNGGFWIMDDTDWLSTSKAQILIIHKGFELYEDHVAWKIFKKTI